MQIVNTEEWTSKIKEKFDGKKYFIYTLGCQLNENDSEKIAGMLSAAGISKTDKEADADIIIFNTFKIYIFNNFVKIYYLIIYV